jgi:hypothetical protein
MKIVINTCFGGFQLSEKAKDRLSELGYIPDSPLYGYDGIERNHPLLLQVLEELKDQANGWCSNLQVVEVNNHVNWHVLEYDGHEQVEIYDVSKRGIKLVKE